MQKIIDRLKREPIVSRVGLAAILNVLVIAGVIDTGSSEELEGVALGVANLVAIFSARGLTVPVVPASFKKTTRARV
jgi:hypothetical protein